MLTNLRAHLAHLAQADGAALITSIALIVLVVLIVPPPKKRRVRAAVYLLLAHLFFFGFAQLFEPATGAHRSLELVAEFFLLASLGRSAFVLLTQGLFRRSLERLPRIFLDVAHGMIYLIIFLYLLREAGVEPGSLVAGSAVLTGIIGLSMRDTLGNLFAGLALEAQRPFEVGDWIQWDDVPAHIGEVVEINWRATRVVTLDAVEITIPHATLGQNLIVNFSRPKRWSRRSIYFNAPHEVPTQKVHDVVLAAIPGAFGVLADPPPSIVTLAFDERGTQYWVRIFTEEFDKRDRVDGGVRDRIWYALERAGISIPSPRRDVAVHDVSPAALERERQEETAARVQALGRIDFLAPLEDADRQRLAALSRIEQFARGERIIRQGEVGHELYLLRQGEVVVELENPGPDVVEVARMRPGDFFGEMSLLTGEPRSATVRAVQPCELLVIGKAAVAGVLSAHPALAEQMSRIIAHRRASLTSRQNVGSAPTDAPEEEWGARLLKRIKDCFSI